MPWTIDSPPSVATNWTDEEKRKCVDAANAALADGASDEQAIFACIRAAGRSTEMTINHFLFTELAADALTEGRAFDGMAFGTFWDMYGREIALEADDAETFVTNTQAAIEATRAESGELVGLPIDAKDHDKGDGAGWIVGVELVNGIIRLLPKWTEIGRELISKGIRRFFSPTVDNSNKVILGGTLTNWPATRDENNRLMLRPIELQSSIHALTAKGGEDLSDTETTEKPYRNEGGDGLPPIMEANMPDEEIITAQEDTPAVVEIETPEPAAPPRETAPAARVDPAVSAELVREFTQAGDLDVVQLVENVQRKAAELARLEMEDQIAKRQRQWEITNLASQYIGGGKYGLPAKTDELSRFLDSLNAEQFEMATELFERITSGGLVEFQERGHARKLRQRPVPEVHRQYLRDAVASGTSPEAYIAQMDDLGDPSDYDLSEFRRS